MKKVLIATLIAAASLSAFAKEIHFTMEASYPPFESTNEKGEIVGFDVDIANALCKELQANCKFSNQAFDSLIQSVKQKRVDGAISAIDITEARAKQVAFTDAYYESSASFVALKGKADLTSAKKIGVQNGTTFQQYIVTEAKQYGINAYPSIQDAILDIKNGRIDAIFGDTAVLADMMTKEPELQFVGEKVTDPKYFGQGLGIAVNKGNKTLLEELNKGLATLKANGEYQKIYDKWMTNK